MPKPKINCKRKNPYWLRKKNDATCTIDNLVFNSKDADIEDSNDSDESDEDMEPMIIAKPARKRKELKEDTAEKPQAKKVKKETRLCDKIAIENARSFFETEKQRFKALQVGPEINQNLKIGAEFMMMPFSYPCYMDEKNQGIFYKRKISIGGQYQRSGKFSLRMKNSINNQKPEKGKRPLLDEMSVLQKSDFYGDVNLKNGNQAHLGLYPNMYTGAANVDTNIEHDENFDYKSDKFKQLLKSKSAYDLYINYKLALANKAKNEAGDLKYITAVVENDYHPLMIRFELGEFVSDYCRKWKVEEPATDCLASAIKPFSLFLISFFTGILNRLSRHHNINIDMVQRSSFGFATPSIAETAESFRLNIGLMLPAYATIVAKALRCLSAILVKLVNEDKIKREPLTKSAKNTYIESFKNYYENSEIRVDLKEANINSLKKIDDWLAFAFIRIESKGKLAITNSTRRPEVLDFVNATAYNSFNVDSSEKDADSDCFKKALEGILSRITPVSEKANKFTLKTNVKSEEIFYKPFVQKEELDSEIIYSKSILKLAKNDDDLHTDLKEILEILQAQVNSLSKSLETQSTDLKKILKSINDNLIIENPCLPVFIDISVELFYYLSLKQLENGKYQDLELNYGSESEVESESKKIYGKKIVVHNGMRAILVATDAISEIIKNGNERIVRIDIKGTYYETPLAYNTLKCKYETKFKKPQEAEVLLRDRNAAVTGHDNPIKKDLAEEIKVSKVKYWIIDVSSATIQQMQVLVRAFLENKIILILALVSSGMKNEQGGDDRNNYGTIRVFTHHDKKLTNKILSKIKEIDKPLSGLAHHLRRIHKSLGNTPTNSEILIRSYDALHCIEDEDLEESEDECSDEN